jgi:hypothetical protein
VLRTPTAAARWAARGCWARAQARSNQEREAVEQWDTGAAERLNPEAWRRQTVACDPAGELRRARLLAGRARVLARTSADRCAAVRLQARLAYEAGDRPAEVEAARRLLVLDPHSVETRLALRRWAVRWWSERAGKPLALALPGALPMGVGFGVREA